MTEEQIKGWGLKELRPAKDWIVKDFTPYRIKGQHSLSQVAFLCHEVDPAFDQSGNTWWIHPFFRNKYTTPYFRKIGTNKIYPRTEIATPPTEHSDATKNWKGIPPWERHSEPLVQGDDMEPYLGPLGPIDKAKKQGVYHATEIEMEYHEIWSKIKKTYDYLLIGAQEKTLTVQVTKASELKLSATMDDLRKFFTKYLKERPQFLFIEEVGKEPTPAAEKLPAFEHSSDFRSITLGNGEIFSLTKNEAKVISMLYDAYPQARSSKSLLEKLYANKEKGGALESNLKKAVFKTHPHIYEALIESTGQGLHRLKAK